MTFNTSDDDEATSGTMNHDQLANGIAGRSIDKQQIASPNCSINYHTYPLPSTTIHTGFPAPPSFQLLTKTRDMKAEFLKVLTHYTELSRRLTTSAAVITPTTILHGAASKDAIPPPHHLTL
ncbi:hypothetical protein HOY82DRAFT_606408 [Tuber indicum]|nr:hypothetical protein HOY82DRAFT_606408 [Tuber indicum]